MTSEPEIRLVLRGPADHVVHFGLCERGFLHGIRNLRGARITADYGIAIGFHDF